MEVWTALLTKGCTVTVGDLLVRCIATSTIARDAGARSFETFHVPQSLIDYFADDPETQRKLLAINKKREQWNKERRVEIKRKKQEKEGTTY